jgi:hypothetical protein
MTASIYRHLVDPAIRHAAGPMTEMFAKPSPAASVDIGRQLSRQRQPRTPS